MQRVSPATVGYRSPRKLDKALFQQLATCRWIADKRNLLVTGPCGVGKSWLSCALAQKACRDGYTSISRAVVKLLLAPRSTSKASISTARMSIGLSGTDAVLIFNSGGNDARSGLSGALLSRNTPHSSLVSMPSPARSTCADIAGRSPA